MRGCHELRVGLDEGEGLAPRLLEHGAVPEEIGDAELGQSGLPRAEEVAGPAQLEVDLGDLEAVIGSGHGGDPAFGVLRGRAGEQDAVALPRAAAHPAAQLVELGEPEALGVLHEHDGGVGHVDADLDHGGRDQDMERALLELAHDALFLREAQPAVEEPHAALGKDLTLEPLRHLRGRAQVRGLRLLHEGTDHVDLPARRHLVAEEGIDLLPGPLPPSLRPYGLAAGRQLVEHGNLEIAVEGEGERAGNRCGRHHENVGALGLAAKRRAMPDAEAVLLVDHGQPESLEGHASLHQRVRADGAAGRAALHRFDG